MPWWPGRSSAWGQEVGGQFGLRVSIRVCCLCVHPPGAFCSCLQPTRARSTWRTIRAPTQNHLVRSDPSGPLPPPPRVCFTSSHRGPAQILGWDPLCLLSFQGGSLGRCYIDFPGPGGFWWELSLLQVLFKCRLREFSKCRPIAAWPESAAGRRASSEMHLLQHFHVLRSLLQNPPNPVENWTKRRWCNLWKLLRARGGCSVIRTTSENGRKTQIMCLYTCVCFFLLFVYISGDPLLRSRKATFIA